MFRPTFLAGLCLTLTCLPAAQAAKVKVWSHSRPGNFDKAQFHHAGVSNEGALRLSRLLKPYAGLSAMHVWDITEDSDGNLYVATGDEGKIYKVTPQAKVSVAYESQESQILCLARGPDGAIYAGTGPSGRIIRIPASGKPGVFYQSPEHYVWALAVDPATKNIYAATGPKGRIYQVTPQGKGSIFYTTKQEHVMCLARGPDGMLYAGTAKKGLVYRIDEKGKGFVLYQTPQSEVRSLLVTGTAVYACTSSLPNKRAGDTVADDDSSRGSNTAGLPAPAPKRPIKDSSSTSRVEPARYEEDSSAPPAPARLSAPPSQPSSTEPKETPAPAATPPSGGENSLYCISRDGGVREIFREKALLLCLLQKDGRFYVGTGMQGQLFEVNESTREYSEVARLDHGQIQCLYQRKNGSIVLGTGDPGKLYLLEDRFNRKGTITSSVLDSGMISRWGTLSWKGSLPQGTHASVAVRSGNLAEPDETWSDWSAEQTDPDQARIGAPTARFLQYRVTLTTDHAAASPQVHALTLRYQNINQAPEVTRLDVPNLDAVNLSKPKKLKIKWSATDANEDELTYSLLIRKEGWQNWVQLEDNLTKTEYDWDTTTTPAGMYRIKLVASDRKDNPEKEALTGVRTSDLVAVAHVPPTVTVKVVGMEGDRAVVEATASDPLVRLTAASFAVNGKEWTNVFPDGLFDKKTARFQFKTDRLKPGAHVLVMRVRDAAGNTGSGDAVFTVQVK